MDILLPNESASTVAGLAGLWLSEKESSLYSSSAGLLCGALAATAAESAVAAPPPCVGASSAGATVDAMECLGNDSLLLVESALLL